MTFFGDLIDRLARPPQDIRADHLREWAASIEGTTAIAQLETRSRSKVAGVIQTVRIDPREGSGSIEAIVNDGSGRLIVKWLGRQHLAGIGLGAGLIFTGTIGRDTDGELLVLNPEYELVPAPEHG